MFKIGSKMKLRHFRGRTELPWVMVDDNFSFNYQDNRNIAPLKWLPGDQFAIGKTFLYEESVLFLVYRCEITKKQFL